ncbi:DNA/RNA nuclease SfsA [Alkalicella caledoniensis]|uniref:Sugar fermentation stimulation protein homolog n=1 Tax=Alkalicella caledoniensis TaxID=2731377 RepID=A0A7G9W773_ALKCA|nr:DNA/RNA nuclease SfsA [Alkalicella caledoniensis]QNO14535.1 DNA/RNA nuclease SfsA [Alkalicella caledoniensis]
MTLLKIQGDLTEAKFLERLNRFTARVFIDGEEQLAHVPTSGRLKELLLPNATVLIRRCIPNPKRKTCFDLLQVLSQDGVWVSLDSLQPNAFMERLLIENSLYDFRNIQRIKREVKYKNSRFDVYTVDEDGKEGFIEVKSVTLVEEGVAKFPDAPSTRGAKHLLELIEATKEGYQCSVVFIVQRNDAKHFTPNRDTDPQFSENLEKAIESGVKAYAYTSIINRSGIQLQKKIPVVL